MGQIIYMKRALLMIAICGSIGCSTRPAGAASDSQPTLRESDPIRLFMFTCLRGGAVRSEVARHAKQIGFHEASNDRAKVYLNDVSGDAWYGRSDNGAFGLTASSNGVCSVFVHQGEEKELRAGMERLLPQNPGAYKTERTVTPELTRTTYSFFSGSDLWAVWTVTAYNDPNSAVKAILSYDSLGRSDRRFAPVPIKK